MNKPMNEDAVGFDYPNHVAPANYNQINHKHLSVPRPTNEAAKKCNPQEIMRAVNEGK